VFRQWRTCSKALQCPIGSHVPGGELLEALLVVTAFFGEAYTAGAEAVDGAGGREKSWYSVEGV